MKHIVLDRQKTADTDVQSDSGICAGTSILTKDGEMPIELLTVGTKVITRDAGYATLEKITKRTVKMSAIRIKAGSLGHTRPDRDMVVAPQTHIHVRDWRAFAMFGSETANIAASRLVDGEFLSHEPVRDVEVYELKFASQHILFADGVELLSAEV